jgi:hypothetical protein
VYRPALGLVVCPFFLSKMFRCVKTAVTSSAASSSSSSSCASGGFVLSSRHAPPTGSGARSMMMNQTALFSTKSDHLTTRKLSSKITKKPPKLPTTTASSVAESGPIRPWPARTAQGYQCKHCLTLGRGNYCVLHKEMKSSHSLAPSPPSQAVETKTGFRMTNFAKENPSLAFAALCVLQQVADSPIAQ